MRERTKHITFSLIIIVMVMIFMFSNQNASDSTQLTNVLIDKLFSEDHFLYEYSFILLRKSAHFLIFFTLGSLIYAYLRIIKHNYAFRNGLFFSFLYAVFDEFHQFFIDGRSPELTDVLIDTSGAFVGILFVILVDIKVLKKIFPVNTVE